MGWDAHATRNGESLRIGPDNWSIEDLPFRSAFESASRRLLEICDQSYPYLSSGQLSGSPRKEMFERALRFRFRDIPGGVLEWSPEQVRQMHNAADWTFDFDAECTSDFWACRFFLQTCAEQGLGIFMSW
jgi:hypothetical protein